jgi:hypothetical protein
MFLGYEISFGMFEKKRGDRFLYLIKGEVGFTAKNRGLVNQRKSGIYGKKTEVKRSKNKFDLLKEYRK